jgi:hypothetical protein
MNKNTVRGCGVEPHNLYASSWVPLTLRTEASGEAGREISIYRRMPIRLAYPSLVTPRGQRH